MVLAITATVFLFATPAFSLNSNIAIDVATFSQFVPETEYSKDIDVVKLLGTDTIQIGINFKLDIAGLSANMHGDRDKINESIIGDSVDDVILELREPVDLITDFTVRSTLKSIIKNEVSKQVEEGIANVFETQGVITDSTPAEIMNEVGMDDAYFENFAYALYDSANKDGATIDSVNDVLYDQIDVALAKTEDTGLVDASSFTVDKRDIVKDGLSDVFNSLHLINEDGSIKKVNTLAFTYLATYLKDRISDQGGDTSKLDQKAGESDREYCDRLIKEYVYTVIPEAVYTALGYVNMALLICLFIFAGLWVLLFLITLVRTFSKKKPWTVFGPWFWILGSLQLVLGLALTIAFKFVIPNRLDLSKMGDVPVKSIILAPRTYALIPSILFLAAIILAFVYGFFKRRVRKQIRNEEAANNEKE